MPTANALDKYFKALTDQELLTSKILMNTSCGRRKRRPEVRISG